MLRLFERLWLWFKRLLWWRAVRLLLWLKSLLRRHLGLLISRLLRWRTIRLLWRHFGLLRWRTVRLLWLHLRLLISRLLRLIRRLLRRHWRRLCGRQVRLRRLRILNDVVGLWRSVAEPRGLSADGTEFGVLIDELATDGTLSHVDSD